jgi:hypothetical protein
VAQRLAFVLAASALLLGFGLVSQLTPMGLQAPTAVAQPQSTTVACRLVGPTGERLVTMVVPVGAAGRIAEHGGGTVVTTTFTSFSITVSAGTTFLETLLLTETRCIT